MKKIIAFVLLIICCSSLSAQQPVTENIIIVTFDGFRWQELFHGADEELINNPSFTKDTASLKKKFWAPSAEERRKRLLPFVWSTIVEQGQVYGNRAYGNLVNVRNPYRVSYPGYNEIFTGYPDPLISNNKKKHNNNTTVLSFLNQQPGLQGKVAAFTSWEVFRYIFNKDHESFVINAGVEPMEIATPAFVQLNSMQKTAFQPFGKDIRPDQLTYALAKEYIVEKKPRVLYIGFDDTDDWAHNKKYDNYLEAANATDGYLAELWGLIQSLPEYKDKTTLIVTTDHGRGDVIKKEWTSHGKKVVGSEEIWLICLGKGITAKGEIKEKGEIFQSQLAQTIAQFLDLSFSANHPVDKAIELKK